MTKPLLILICLSIALSGCASSWTRLDTATEMTILAFKAADWRQTRYIAQNPETFWEVNPVMGKHPSTTSVDVYFLSTAILGPVIANVLPPKARKVWQALRLGGSFAYVIHNQNLGVPLE